MDGWCSIFRHKFETIGQDPRIKHDQGFPWFVRRVWCNISPAGLDRRLPLIYFQLGEEFVTRYVTLTLTQQLLPERFIQNLPPRLTMSIVESPLTLYTTYTDTAPLDFQSSVQSREWRSWSIEIDDRDHHDDRWSIDDRPLMMTIIDHHHHFVSET